MRLNRLLIYGFRNFDSKTFEFDPQLTIVFGNNAVGKTNLLEALYFVSYGAGFRESRQEELIQKNAEQSDVEAVYIHDDQNNQFRIILSRNSTPSKHYLINKSKKRSYDYLAQSPLVTIFSPSFMYIIDGEPKSRRSFFDRILEKSDKEYRTKLKAYENNLRKRNKLLEKSSDREKLREELVFWDTNLIEQAAYLQEKRAELVKFFNTFTLIDSIGFELQYEPNTFTQSKLDALFDRQFYAKKTFIGPQRDVYEIVMTKQDESKSVHIFGSRSEQRLALLWLIIIELRFFEHRFGQQPLLLLDDIFSELDVENRTIVLDIIGKYQTVLTTTEKETFDLITTSYSTIPLP